MFIQIEHSRDAGRGSIYLVLKRDAYQIGGNRRFTGVVFTSDVLHCA